MTDWHDVARAVSLTRVHEWGTEVQVLLALSAEPAWNGEITVSLSDLARDTGLDTGRVWRALRGQASMLGLNRRKVISIDSGPIGPSGKRGGQEPNSIWIREPREWGLVPWRVGRDEAITIIDASFGLHARTQDLDSARAQARARSRSRFANSANATWVARAPLRARSNASARASGRARKPAQSVVSRSGEVAVRRGELDGLTDRGLSQRSADLVAAFFEGNPSLPELFGRPLARLCRVAEDGEIGRLCGEARDLSHPGGWADHLGQLEAALTAPAGSVGSVSVETAWRQASEIERLERQERELLLAGFGEEAEEVSHRLASMRACESVSER